MVPCSFGLVEDFVVVFLSFFSLLPVLQASVDPFEAHHFPVEGGPFVVVVLVVVPG